MSFTLNYWQQQYLQSIMNRWHDYKGTGIGGGSFSDDAADKERILITSIRTKIQVVPGTNISLSPDENYFLQSLLYMGKQDYGRGSGQSVFETGVRQQVQQRTVMLNDQILAKLRGTTPPIVVPGETEALES